MFSRALPFSTDDDERKDIFGPVADLMVGVVFIFIILMIALSLYLQPVDTKAVLEENAQLRAQNQRLLAEIAQLRAQNQQLLTENEALRDFVEFVRDSQIRQLLERMSRADETRVVLLRDLQQRLSLRDINVIIDPENGTLKLPSGRLFESARADPTPEGRETILGLGAVLAEVLPCYISRQDQAESAEDCPQPVAYSTLSAVYIEGHTDAVPFTTAVGRFRDNWDLSAGRAIEAFKLLRDNFPILKGLRNQDGDALLGVSGYAETRPADGTAADRTDPLIREQDRRIEVRITMTADEQAVGKVLDEFSERLEQVDGFIR